MSEKDGGPVYPQNVVPRDGEMLHEGQSLRDWFAGQAISALVARHRADVAWGDIAPTAYAIADAMIAARSR